MKGKGFSFMQQFICPVCLAQRVRWHLFLVAWQGNLGSLWDPCPWDPALLVCRPCLGRARGFPPCGNLSIVLFSEAWGQLRFVFEELSLSLLVFSESLFKAPGSVTEQQLGDVLPLPSSWGKLRTYQSFIQAVCDQPVVSRNFSEVLAHGCCPSLMSFSSDVKCHRCVFFESY